MCGWQVLILWKSAADRYERFLWSIKICKLHLVNLLPGEMGPDIRQCGGAGPHTVPGGKTVWGSWAPDSLVLQYVWGMETGPTTYFP